MNITSVANLADISKYASDKTSTIKTTGSSGFDSILKSAVDLVKETNSYSNAAEEEEMSYALGTSDNTHDLQVAQEKANISLQYTLAVRNGVMDAYKEIMNLQF